MLGNEDGMIPHGCLLSVVKRQRRGETFCDEVPAVLKDFRKSLLPEIILFLPVQAEPTSETRSPKSIQNDL